MESLDPLVHGIRSKARRMGFDAVGITSPDASDHVQFFREWLESRFHGTMTYLARTDAVARRADLRKTMGDVRSVVVVTQNYHQEDSPGVPEDPARGVVARFARGQDYHVLMKSRLQELLAWVGEAAKTLGVADGVRGFPYVDTGPILERELAHRAGLGWFGRNTLLIHPKRGSYFLLGVLLMDLELPTGSPPVADHCGSCQRCLEACPTGALLGRNHLGAPVMDARRCISYLTIELRGPIPRDLRPLMGNRLFGCDICQEVCPWNSKFACPAEDPAYRGGADTDGPALVELMGLSDEEFSARFSGSPIKRAKRRGLLRNVAVAMGNWLGKLGDPPDEAVAALVGALSDPEPLVRGHAAWALGEILSRVGIPGDGGFEVAEALPGRLEVEEDVWVREEIESALLGPPRRATRGSSGESAR